MAAELITAGTVLVGAGTWFSGKIFDPTADAMGSNLKVYLQARMPTIFGVAEVKAQALNIDLQPIKPGLLARMVVDASFSDEDSEVTDWWANLFLSASHSSSNKHAVFSDMMAVIGPTEAGALRDFVESFDFAREPRWFNQTQEMRSSIELVRDRAVEAWVGATPITDDRLQQVYSNMTSGQLPWPMRPISWSLPAVHAGGGFGAINQLNPWYSKNRDSVEILERSRVLKFSRVIIPLMDFTAWVDTVELTGLGLEFYAACRGYDTLSKAGE